MVIDFEQHVVECDLYAEATWQELYAALHPLAKRIVFAFRVPAWRGQENDIAEDIVQETVRKLIERVQKAERSEALPIYALKPMVRVIAYNYGKDMRRHDQRLSRVSEGEEVVEQAGIRLQEYQHMLPVTNDERNKYTSLLAHAYKRVSLHWPNATGALMKPLGERLFHIPATAVTKLTQFGGTGRSFQQGAARARPRCASIVLLLTVTTTDFLSHLLRLGCPTAVQNMLSLQHPLHTMSA
jgi:DNA-directed RNA polymerase specialized sigma24 family protein